MRIDLLTLFPELCQVALSTGVIGRAVASGKIRAVVTDFRQFAHGRHGSVDDTPYGGGPGMLLRPEPVVAAVESVMSDSAAVVLTTPAGEPFTQRTAQELARREHLIFLCGRYKGFDERVRELVVTHEFSIGDYVLSGGELPALVMADAIVRRIPGTLGNLDSADSDSFSAGRGGGLDAAHYTRPPEYRGLRVPEVLLSGDHGAVAEFEERSSHGRTEHRRPDLRAAQSSPRKEEP
jgi:tRNA (guanine37-N1)-methyltransferase